MSYLLDRKIKRKKLSRIAIFAGLFFILIYFRTPIWNGLSYFSHSVFRPFIVTGNNIGQKFKNIGSFFSSKEELMKENESLQLKLSETDSRISNYNSILDENLKLKEIIGRKNEKQEMILSAILSKPNISPYDTLIIDIGEDKGITAGNKVFAFGNVPIGYVSDVYRNSSKVILYTTPNEKTEVVITGKDLFIQLIGRGGGNFEMILPRDLILQEGTEVHLPGITPYAVAITRTIISDPRDSFSKALLTSPINIQELKFVEVEK